MNKSKSSSQSGCSVIKCIDNFFRYAPPPPNDWIVSEVNDGRCRWIEIRKNNVVLQELGWKLHVSATVDSAIAILEAILPILKTFDVCFKVSRSLQDLAFLNSGKAGLSQVGKFVTIYPGDEDQLIELAFQMDDLTFGQEGPVVPSDRPLRPGSLVHYRYGAFTKLTYQTNTGLVVPVIRNPQGEFIEEIRSTVFSHPDWASDPFEIHNLLPPISPKSPLLNERYLCIAPIYKSVKGDLYLAVDIDSEDGRGCIIKQSHRGIYLDSRVNASTMLKHEKQILERIQSHNCFPRVYDYFESEGNSYLVLEYLEGIDLHSYVLSRACLGIFLRQEEIVDLGLQLCAILQILHTNGIIFRDLKPANILVTKDSKIKLLDFETAFEQTNANSICVDLGTRGYCSPQQKEGHEPTIADDIFGVGALLYFLSTNYDPSVAPREWAFFERWINKLNPDIQPPLQSVIAKCLELDATKRYTSIEEVAQDLIKVHEAPYAIFNYSTADISTVDFSLYLSLADHLGKQLCEIAERMEVGISWASTHKYSYGIRQRDIHVGTSGIGLFLIDLYTYIQREVFRGTIERACDWLMEIDYVSHHFLPGLYVGESGVGLLMLKVGQVLKSTKYLDASIMIANNVYRKLPSSPDLFNGLAGCGLYFLILAEVTNENSFLLKARTVGDRLIELAECIDDVCNWVIPSGYATLSGQKYLGFAHGAAGIGYFLLELFDMTGYEKYKEYALKAANYIIRMGQPALNDRSGINWPDIEGGEIQSLFWCHGAVGIGRFLLRLHQVCQCSDHLDLARRAAMLVATGGRWLNPTQCHGLSGNIEFLIDMYQVTNERDWLMQAVALAEILKTYAVEQNGNTLWPSEEPTIVTPDFMVGYAGVGECFLRLHTPQFHPHLISRQYFKIN